MATAISDSDPPGQRLFLSEQPQLSVAVVAAGNTVSEYELELINRIELDPDFHFGGVIFRGVEQTGRVNGQRRAARKVASVLLGIAASIENALSEKLDASSKDPHPIPGKLQTFSLERTPEAPPNEPMYRVVSPSSERFRADVAVSFARLPESFSIEGVRYGVWTLAYSDLTSIDGDPPAFWEVYLGEGVTGVTLSLLHSGTATTLATALFPTKLTYTRNLALLRDNAVELVWRELRRWQSGQRTAKPFAANVQGSRHFPRPSGYQVIKYAASAASRVLGKLLRRSAAGALISTEHWSLFVGAGRYDASSWAAAIESRPPSGESWADPFLIRDPNDTKDYVFFEKFSSAVRRGRISVGRIADRKIEFVGDAVVVPYHISYPQVFRYGGETWMLPETCEMRRLELWKCVQFPLEWRLETTALHGMDLVDPTICEHDGHWWLFANAASHNSTDHNSELHIFRLGSPMLEDVVPHRLNPVVIDATRARSGGRIHRANGVLMRSGQNNSFRYGYGLGVYAIRKLTLDEYEEELVFRVQPNFRPDLVACHHLDANDEIFVFDGQRRWPDLSKLRP